MGKHLSVGFVSLGCAKNLVDSEKMLAQLAEGGCLVGADLPQAEVIVVNTCGFLAEARSEAHRAVREAVEMKRAGRCRRVVVAGCLVQRDGKALLEAVPGIDALVGVNRRDDLLQAVRGQGRRRWPRRGEQSRGRPDLFLGESRPRPWSDAGRLRLTPRHYAYLRISEGCDQECTFCTIPSIRGPMRSKPVERVLQEARELIDAGALELNLIGQDTTAYGKDLGYEAGLAGLLRELNRLEGVHWLRLLYAYPAAFPDAVIDAVAECEKVVKYVDLPLQHINDRILRAMGRRVTREQTQALLDRLRGRIAGLALRTTLITGFPGESQADFEELVDFVRRTGFEALGVFAFSPEPETPAGRIKNQLPEEVKTERVELLMRTQQEVAFQNNRRRVGTTFEVMVERGDPDTQGYIWGRSAFQAPEVDSVTRLADAAGPAPGTILSARCTGWQDYDLIARPTKVMLPVAENS